MGKQRATAPLLAHIVQSLIDPALKKRLFRAPTISFWRYLGCYEEAFEIGVVLGYAYRRKLVSFAKLFSQPNRETEIAGFVQQLARNEVAAQSSVPESFFPLGMFAERERIRKRWRDSGASDTQIESSEQQFEVSVATAFSNLQVAVSTGIGLGSAMPELAQSLWRAEHEGKVDPEKPDRLRRAGLNLPEDMPKAVSLAERQAYLTAMVEQFVTVHRPDLLTELIASR